MKSPKSFQFVLIAAVLSAIAATADASAAGNSCYGALPERADIAVNSGAAMMISHLRKAELLLDTGAVAGARSVLAATREFARELQMMKMGADRAYAHIIDAGVPEHAGVSTRSSDWVGIYSNLDEMQAYAPHLAEQTRERLNQAERHARWGDIHGAASTLKHVAAEVPSSLQPGHDIDQQILLSLELLGENHPDTAAVRRVVDKALNTLTAIGDLRTTAARRIGGVYGEWRV